MPSTTAMAPIARSAHIAVGPETTPKRTPPDLTQLSAARGRLTAEHRPQSFDTVGLGQS